MRTVQIWVPRKLCFSLTVLCVNCFSMKLCIQTEWSLGITVSRLTKKARNPSWRVGIHLLIILTRKRIEELHPVKSLTIFPCRENENLLGHTGVHTTWEATTPFQWGVRNCRELKCGEITTPCTGSKAENFLLSRFPYLNNKINEMSMLGWHLHRDITLLQVNIWLLLEVWHKGGVPSMLQRWRDEQVGLVEKNTHFEVVF